MDTVGGLLLEELLQKMVGFMRRHKLPVVVGCLLLLFLCLKKGKQVRHYELFIPKHEPKVVWDVLADFNNIAQMNTRISQWELLDEEGDMDRWSYRLITYEGMVGDWLFGPNINRGTVVVEPVAPPDHYYRQEVYITSSFRGLMTVHNSGTMNLHRGRREGVSGTLLLHRTFSDCPLIFHFLCILETDINRSFFEVARRKKTVVMREVTTVAVMVIVLVMDQMELASSSSSSSPEPTKTFHEVASEKRCLGNLLSATVPSLAVCAALCRSEDGCAAFSMDDWGQCEVTDSTSLCGQQQPYSYMYLPYHTGTTTPQPAPATTSITTTTTSVTTTSQPTTTAVQATTTTTQATTTTTEPTTATTQATTTAAQATTTAAQATTTTPALTEVECGKEVVDGMAAVGAILNNNKKSLTHLKLAPATFHSMYEAINVSLGQQCPTHMLVTATDCNPGQYTCQPMNVRVGFDPDVCVRLEMEQDASCPQGKYIAAMVKGSTNGKFTYFTCCHLEN